MKSIFTVAILIYGWVFATSSNPQKVMENQVKQTITDFTQAAEERNMEALEAVLHPDFRVVLNRFKGTDHTTILDRKTYLAMISGGKIGGEHYELKIRDVKIHDHSGAARVEWKNEKTTFRMHFLLVKNAEDKWQIISDMPVVSLN